MGVQGEVAAWNSSWVTCVEAAASESSALLLVLVHDLAILHSGALHGLKEPIGVLGVLHTALRC